MTAKVDVTNLDSSTETRTGSSNEQASHTDYDVTGRISLVVPRQVQAEIERIFSARYPDADLGLIARAFDHFICCYYGEHPKYHGCDTPYHNIHHVMNVTLTTARLIDGYEQENPKQKLNCDLAVLGVVVALFHDAGYLRFRDDFESRHGAEYTKIHVTRSGEFLEQFLTEHNHNIWVEKALALVQYTGIEQDIEELLFDEDIYTQLGYLIGTADLIAQMSDRDYIEKCRLYLYDEFKRGGLDRRQTEDGREEIIYNSADDLVNKTPGFIRMIKEDRLTKAFDKAYQYAAVHFSGSNLYMDSIERNYQQLLLATSAK